MIWEIISQALPKGGNVITRCLTQLIGCMGIGLLLLIVIPIALAQQNGLGWIIGLIIGLAVIGHIFKS